MSYFYILKTLIEIHLSILASSNYFWPDGTWVWLLLLAQGQARSQLCVSLILQLSSVCIAGSVHVGFNYHLERGWKDYSTFWHWNEKLLGTEKNLEIRQRRINLMLVRQILWWRMAVIPHFLARTTEDLTEP